MPRRKLAAHPAEFTDATILSSPIHHQLPAEGQPGKTTGFAAKILQVNPAGISHLTSWSLPTHGTPDDAQALHPISVAPRGQFWFVPLPEIRHSA